MLFQQKFHVPIIFKTEKYTSINDGYLITGTTQQYNPEFGYIIKLDNNFNVNWAKAYDTYANGSIGG